MSPVRTIDLNADLGEDVGDDEALLSVVSSANIACGAHAGSQATMRRACALAVEHGVVIGAHPGYADREHFGRRALQLPAAELAASLAAQYQAIGTAAANAGGALRYVKPHGALYHRSTHDAETAEVVYREAIAFDPALRFLAAPGSLLIRHATRADHGVRAVVEGFADRGYVAGRSGEAELVERGRPGALLGHDAAVEQAVSLATTGLARAADGSIVAVHPQSLCVHGDSPGAVSLAREIRAELERAGVTIRAFAQ